jgi:FkbM family methyltransferase
MSAIRGLIPAWAVEITRRLVECLDPDVRLAYAQEGEDMILRRLLEGYDTGFYVDVGAHHPFRFSNTGYFYRRGWRGMNIDPNPQAIQAFDRHRPGDINVCVGIADSPGNLTFYSFNEPALNTFDSSLASERAQMRDYHMIEKRSVVVRRLDDLLDEYLPSGQSIDFLSVDVEGMDLAVLRSGDWVRIRPRLLLVEGHERTVSAAEQNPICLFAREIGYQLIAKTLNTLIFEDREAQRRGRRPRV